MDSNSSKRTPMRISFSVVYFVATYIMYILSCIYLNSRKGYKYRPDILFFVTFLTMHMFGILLIFTHTYDLRNDRIYFIIIKTFNLWIWLSFTSFLSTFVVNIKSYGRSSEDFPKGYLFYFVSSLIWSTLLFHSGIFISIEICNCREQAENGEKRPYPSNYHIELIRKAILHDSKGERYKAIETFKELVTSDDYKTPSKSFYYFEIYFFLKYCSEKYESKIPLTLVEKKTKTNAQFQVAENDKKKTCVCCDEEFEDRDRIITLSFCNHSYHLMCMQLHTNGQTGCAAHLCSSDVRFRLLYHLNTSLTKEKEMEKRPVRP